jgi:hypothetical protein
LPTIKLYANTLGARAEWVNSANILRIWSGCAYRLASTGLFYIDMLDWTDDLGNQIPADAIIDEIYIGLKAAGSAPSLGWAISFEVAHAGFTYAILDDLDVRTCTLSNETESIDCKAFLGGITANDLRTSGNVTGTLLHASINAKMSFCDYVYIRVVYHVAGAVVGRGTGNTFLLAVLAMLASMQGLKKRRRKKLIKSLTTNN